MQMLTTTRLLIYVFLVGTATLALGENHGDHGLPGQSKGNLNGYNEVPVVLTTGSGQITLTVSSDQKSLSVTLTFTRLAGVAQSASLYLGSAGTTGGVVAPICGVPKPTCPTTADGQVTTTLSANDVLGIPAQGLIAGDLASVIQAIASEGVYVNVVTSKFPNGEIRGQLERGEGQD
jgi:hypothetical protein